MDGAILGLMGGISVASILGCVFFACDRYWLSNQLRSYKEGAERRSKEIDELCDALDKAGVPHPHAIHMGLRVSMPPRFEWREYMERQGFSKLNLGEQIVHVGLDDNNRVVLVVEDGPDCTPEDLPSAAFREDQVHDLMDAVMVAHTKSRSVGP